MTTNGNGAGPLVDSVKLERIRRCAAEMEAERRRIEAEDARLSAELERLGRNARRLLWLNGLAVFCAAASVLLTLWKMLS